MEDPWLEARNSLFIKALRLIPECRGVGKRTADDSVKGQRTLNLTLPILQSVLQPYVPAAVFLLVVLFTAVVFHGLTALLGPKRTQTKLSTYECGAPLLASARERFSVKFYLVALLFVLFDIETVFLIPWAVKFQDLLGLMGIFAVIEMFVFIGILGVGLLYAWRRGGLEWE